MWKYTDKGTRLHYFAGTSIDGKSGISLCGLIRPLKKLRAPIGQTDSTLGCMVCESELYRPKWK